MKIAGLVAFTLALPLTALAQTPGTDGLGSQEPIGGAPLPSSERSLASYASPQHYAIELKFTPYTPHIDQSRGLAKGATPFADLFNPQDPVLKDGNWVSGNKGKQPPYRLLTTVEFDYQFLHKSYGNFGVGLTTGFYRRTTHSFELSSTGGACTVPFCVRSGDQTGLNILPLTALFIYRFDQLANRYHIPLVPYAKIGLAYYVWWINDGNGILSAAEYPRPGTGSTAKSESGYGGTFGFVVHPGIALQLDFLERAVAKTMDAELGINHTYLFCELNYANINGFGASNKLDLSDTMINTGMGFEF